MLESSKVPALTRAIDILNLIARIGPCSAATIIDTLGIPKSTAYLLLNELRRQRFLSLDHQENFCLWTRLVEAFRSCVKQDGSPGTGSTAFDATDGYHWAVMSPGDY
ncbi:transcriptional regulator YfaX [Escherichia coli]|nr:transcriptional regulator YfaX [Escherichia coli]